MSTAATGLDRRFYGYGAGAVAATLLVGYLLIADPQSQSGTQQLLDGIYCNRENCYDVLGVTRASTRAEIAKSYRKLARQFHPDVQRGDDAQRAESEEQFMRVANAYEILKDDDQRTDYDYMLDNPQEYYAHYYRYFRRRVSPKVDVRAVLVVAVSIVSAIQYYSAWQRYEDAIKYFLTVPKYRNKATEIIQQREKEQQNGGGGGGAGAASGASASGKRGGRANKLSKSEQRERIEQNIREVIVEFMDIKGAYAKPSWCDVLWVQLALAPWSLAKYVGWYASWTWRFRVLGHAYGDTEKLYLIRKLLGLGVHEFANVSDESKADYMERELWQPEKFVAWKRADMEEQAKMMADNPQHKKYRRYMKNHGPGRMTFED